MSFSSTPLGQGRRLDHHTFLGKAPSTSSTSSYNSHHSRARSNNSNHSNNPTGRPTTPPFQRRNIPNSYAYGAPAASTRSPPKPTAATASGSAAQGGEDDSDLALARFARIKQQSSSSLHPSQQQPPARPPSASGSHVNTISPHPEKWAVKDTSVQIASAFHQAATSSFEDNNSLSGSGMNMNPNNQAWAAGGTARAHVPRSSSIEYENQSQGSRRFGAPPSRIGAARVARPLSKNASAQHIPDSEGEGDSQSYYYERSGEMPRGKTPLGQLVETARNLAAKGAEYLMKAPSDSPSSPPANGNGHVNPNGSSSYDYEDEEAEYNASAASLSATQRRQQQQQQRHRRNRMSTDNKAYKPTLSDLEASDEDYEDDDGKRRRRKKKKAAGGHGGPLNTLPVTSYSKRRKRKGKGGADEDEDDEEGESSEQDEEPSQQEMRRESEQRSVRGVTPAQRAPSVPRTSAQPPTSRLSVPRGGSIPAHPIHDPENPMGVTTDIEHGLDSIAEESEEQPPEPDVDEFEHEGHHGPRASFSIGATLGKCVHWSISLVWRLLFGIWTILWVFLSGIRQILGSCLDYIFVKPTIWISSADFRPVVKYLTGAAAIYAVWYALNHDYIHLDKLSIPVPSWPSSPAPYRPPEMAPADVAELSSRLQQLENVLAGLSRDVERQQSYINGDARTVVGRLGALETRLQQESMRHLDLESKVSASASQGISTVKHEVEVLQAQLQAQKDRAKQWEKEQEARLKQIGPISDEEARAQLKALQEQLASVQGGVKEALELSKNAAKIDGSANSALAWWNKLASGKGSALTIKSSDGQDVTSLLNQIVENAVYSSSLDTISKADYALHSGGARIIPHLTSETFEIRPQGISSQFLSLITGNGYAIGRPPVTALHHETHNGHCWPFAGTQGQLGVALSAPIHISEITIDHVAKAVATDMRSAPRHMEIWGLIEGRENLAKFQEWEARKAARKEEARAEAEENGVSYVEEQDPPYPLSLPKSPPFIRIANFTYNIHAPRHVQTFSVPQEIQDLDLDFGVVVLLIKSNWGRDEFTCLYRLRVHGERVGEIPLPYPADEDS